jgi:pilus assembly protein FimV
MDRKLVVALSSLIGGITVGGNAYAIGLGDIKLHSALNEPLRAEIKLVQVKDLTENQIIVNLASSEDFANANVDREYFLNSLRFRLDLDDPSNPKVVVTTQQPIREPFLNFFGRSAVA